MKKVFKKVFRALSICASVMTFNHGNDLNDYGILNEFYMLQYCR